MKKFLKVLGIIAVPLLLIAAFYGYHVYRAISLDEENSRTYSATALSFLTSSEEWDKVIQCNPWPKSLSQQRFDPKEYLEIGSIADVYYGRHDKFGKQNGFELKTRYEKDSLDDEARSKWGAGIITNEYEKRDSCYSRSKLIEVDDEDSVTVTEINKKSKNETRRYIGKRKNGIVTECIDCRLNNGVCEDTIRITRIELDPASGKITKRISKTKEMYYGSDLHENGSFNTTTEFYDHLGRLVEASFDGKKFRYEHSTNDSTNLDVKIYDESGKELGFYKRELEKDGSRKIVRYGTNSEEHRITSFYKDGKLVKEESDYIDFYASRRSRTRLFNSAGDEILDSSFYESTMLPGIRFDAHSYVAKSLYSDNGKVKTINEYNEEHKRLASFIIFPLKTMGQKLVGSYELEYDAGRISSITYENHDIDFALRYGYPAWGQRTIFSQERLEDMNECQDPLNQNKISKPRKPQK